MSASGSQTAAFFREIGRHRIIWWVRDDVGSPTPAAATGEQVFPYWSSEARAHRAARIWGTDFRAESMTVDRWRTSALPALAEDGLRVGINWSGPRLTGWDFTVEEVLNRLAHALDEPPYS